MQSPRKAALDTLTRVFRDQSYSNLALDTALKAGGLPPRDEALATALTYGVIERRLTLDYFISHFAKRPCSKISPLPLNILRLGAYQLMYMNKIPASAAVNESVKLAKNGGCAYASGFINGVLRTLERNLAALPYPDPEQDPIAYHSVRYSCPEWLVRQWMKDYGKEDAEGILNSLCGERNNEFPVTIRVNSLKTIAAELIEKLLAEGIEMQPSEWDSDCLLLRRLPELSGFAPFIRGEFIVQGMASQLCCKALDPHPGETVFDLCAAPGGKSFTMAFLMGNQGSISSFDLYESRVGLIREGAARLGIDILKAAPADASKPIPGLGQADCVLCDVPCSGLGVIAKKPEIRYKDPSELKALPELQYRILLEGASHVRPGGRLVYSTCTLSRAENEEVAGRFLKENPDYIPRPLPLPPELCMNPDGMVNAHAVTLMPHRSGTDGFFIASFQRKGL